MPAVMDSDRPQDHVGEEAEEELTGEATGFEAEPGSDAHEIVVAVEEFSSLAGMLEQEERAAEAAGREDRGKLVADRRRKLRRRRMLESLAAGGWRLEA